MKQFLLELIFIFIKIFLNGFHHLSHIFSNIKNTHNNLITIIICYIAIIFNLILTIGNINTFLFAIKLINLDIYVKKFCEFLQHITIKNLFILLILYLTIWTIIFFLIIKFHIYLLSLYLVFS